MSAIYQTVNRIQFPSPRKGEIHPFNVFITLQVLALNPVDLTTVLVLTVQFSPGRTWFLTELILVRVCSGYAWNIVGTPLLFNG